MLEKPSFPKPRTIREDFLPEPMKKYRIKKETYGDTTKYYPQERWFFWWFNIFSCDVYFDGGYSTLEEAQKRLCGYVKGTMVEYLDFDYERDCK
jgi:hypothetical protein